MTTAIDIIDQEPDCSEDDYSYYISFYWGWSDTSAQDYTIGGDSLPEIAQELVDMGYSVDDPHIAAYDEQGSLVGWVGVDEDGSPWWRAN